MKSFSLRFAGVVLLALWSASCSVHKAEPTGLTGPSTAVLPPSAGQISAPVAQFVFGPAAPATNSPVQFDASTTCASGVNATGACNATSNTVTSYAWDFGDGASATGRTASHTFTIPRTYSVTLTVTNSIGLSTASTKLIAIVAGVAPTATFVLSPTSVGVGVSVNVDASQSRAAAGHTLSKFSWSWGDGSSSSHANPQDGHAYSTAGTYVVMLTVTDDAGAEGAAVQNVTVNASAVTAAFVFSPTAPIVGSSINFDASVSKAAPGRSLVQYNWNWGDGSVATTTGSPLTTHTYGSVGTYNVTLAVTDDSGSSATAVQTVTAQPVGSPAAPTAAFVVSPTSPVAGSAAFFDASPSKPAAGQSISSYSWNWGDGSPAGADVKPTHTFASAAAYTVTLTVKDNDNVTGIISQVITVQPVGTPVPPTASFTSSPSGASVNQVINFNATASKAAAGHSLTNYSWNWGDGSGLGSGVTTTHTYTLAGTYTVTLTVTDDASQTAIVSQSIAVGVNPTARFTSSPTAPGVSETVFFDATSSTAAPGFSIAGYAWNFGDGSTSASGPTTSHSYSATGTYTVTLTVTDTAGQKGTTSNTVVVGGAPVARFVISTQPGGIANFNASQSTAAAGHTIVTYAWNFGDNTTGTGVTPTHTYGVGTYTVVLTVTDDVGQTGTATGTVTVTPVTPPAPTAIFSVSKPGGLAVNVDGSQSTAGTGHVIVSYEWHWGDANITGPSGTSTASHLYSGPGTYSIVLIVKDDIGQTATTSQSVTVP
jgi:PKD repeat protein